jgi:hypothetical protein
MGVPEADESEHAVAPAAAVVKEVADFVDFQLYLQ